MDKSTIEKNPKVKIAYEKLIESKELIQNAYNEKMSESEVTKTLSGPLDEHKIYKI